MEEWAKLGDELVVVRNNYNSSIEGFNGTSQGTQTFTIKVVGGLVKNDL